MGLGTDSPQREGLNPQAPPECYQGISHVLDSLQYEPKEAAETYCLFSTMQQSRNRRPAICNESYQPALKEGKQIQQANKLQSGFVGYKGIQWSAIITANCQD